MLLLFLSFSHLSAQMTLSSVNCGQLSVEVDPVAYTGSNHGSNCSYCCGAGTISCQKMTYNVYLRAANISGGISLPTSGNFGLVYSEIYITLKLSRDTNAVASYIDTAQTENCLASYLSTIPDGSYEINAGEDEVTLHISADAGDATPTIPFLNFLSNGLLFGIVVDAFPGEGLGISCVEFSYVSAEECEDSTCTGVNNTPFPAPSNANNKVSISLGDIDCDQEEYIDLPILITSTITSDISFLDFAVVVSNDAPDGFFAAPEFIDILGSTSPSVSVIFNESTSQYIAHISYSSPSWSVLLGTDKQLGVLRIYRPPNLCQGYTIVSSLIPGRVIVPGQSNSNCMSFSTGASMLALCEVEEMDICDEFQFDITTEDDLPDCSTLQVRATLSWDPGDFSGADSLNFNQIRVILEFPLENGVTITNAVLENFSCPGSGNDPVTCAAGCNVSGGNRVEVCINVVTPIWVRNNASILVTFDAPVGCVSDAIVRKVLLKRPYEDACQPSINEPQTGTFPYCSPEMEDFIQGKIATELGCWIQEVHVAIVATETTCNSSVTTGRDGEGNPICEHYTSGCLCDINTAGTYTITPTKNDNPLNGVTTYDLVLISKHILGIEPLSTPYKMIAADVNQSGSITPFDIVETRKLILGVVDTFPFDVSWRFVLDTFTFPNVNNPFQTAFPEFVNISALPDTLVNFIGIKIGDVNNSAAVDCDSCNAFKPQAGSYALRAPRRNALKAGDYYTLPVRAGGEAPLVALQSAFRFDPNLLELISPSLGDAPGLSSYNFNLAQANEGIIRISWFAQPDALEEETLRPGQSLFNLTFRVKQDLPENTQILGIDENLMPCLGWAEDGTAYALQMAASNQRDETGQPDMPVWLRCRPNPSPGEVVFDIVALPQPRRAQLTVFDAFGQRVWWRDLGKETGPLQVNVPEAASWPKGVYHWELRFDKQKSSGTFIRQ